MEERKSLRQRVSRVSISKIKNSRMEIVNTDESEHKYQKFVPTIKPEIKI